MINTELNYVQDINLNNVWREAMLLCIKNGYDFVVKGGSYKGQIRKQLPSVTIKIEQPRLRPLAPIVNPPHLPPTSDEKIEEYFLNYIMSTEVKKNEDYTYGQFIVPQVDRIIEILKQAKGNSNQACISVGNEHSAFLVDPPCLRVLSFKVVEKQLILSVFFRSWDLYAGLPENLGGFQLLKEYVLDQLQDEMEVCDGPIIAYSDGLHIYEQYFQLANDLNMSKIVVTENVLKDKELFNRELDNENSNL